MNLTQVGRTLLAKVLAGATLTFTRAAFGSGTASANPTALAVEKLSLPLISVTAQNGEAVVKAKVTSANNPTAFEIREIGLFARDPDGGNDILYAYENFGNQCDWLPAANSAVAKDYVYNLHVFIDDAADVTAVINYSDIYTPLSNFNEHVQSTDPHPNLKISGGGLFNQPKTNPDNTDFFYEDTISNAVWDEENEQYIYHEPFPAYKDKEWRRGDYTTRVYDSGYESMTHPDGAYASYDDIFNKFEELFTAKFGRAAKFGDIVKTLDVGCDWNNYAIGYALRLDERWVNLSYSPSGSVNVNENWVTFSPFWTYYDREKFKSIVPGFFGRNDGGLAPDDDSNGDYELSISGSPSYRDKEWQKYSYNSTYYGSNERDIFSAIETKFQEKIGRNAKTGDIIRLCLSDGYGYILRTYDRWINLDYLNYASSWEDTWIYSNPFITKTEHEVIEQASAQITSIAFSMPLYNKTPSDKYIEVSTDPQTRESISFNDSYFSMQAGREPKIGDIVQWKYSNKNGWALRRSSNNQWLNLDYNPDPTVAPYTNLPKWNAINPFWTPHDRAKFNSLSAYTLPTASTSTKGGVKIGTGLIMNDDTLSADVDKTAAGRLAALEINQGNLLIEMKGSRADDFPTNRALVENFAACDTLDLFQSAVTGGAAEGSTSITLERVAGIHIGAIYKISDGVRADDVRITALSKDNDVYTATLESGLGHAYTDATLYRTSADIDGVARGPGKKSAKAWVYNSEWKGISSNTSTTAALDLSGSDNLALSGDWKISGGLFTLA